MVLLFRKRGFKLESSTTIEMLGSAEKISVDKDNTTIVNGSGKKIRSKQE